jgi:hypothetical protein
MGELRAVLLEQSVGDLTQHEALAFSKTMVAERRVLPLEDGLMRTLTVRVREEAIEGRFTVLAEEAHSAAALVVCHSDTHYPHYSSHVPGTVNFVATLVCSEPVFDIRMRITLYRNGSLVAESGYQFKGEGAFAKENAAVACINGDIKDGHILNGSTLRGILRLAQRKNGASAR